MGDKVDDFEILQVLGKGSFGFVAKVKSRLNHKIYTMKQIDFSTIEDKKVFEEDITKLIVPEKSVSDCEIAITKDMIDVNEHVHNLDYIDFASQILPYEVMQNAKNVEVMYKKEIKYGEKIKGFYSIIEKPKFR